MNRVAKFLVIGLVSLVVGYYGYSFFTLVWYGHRDVFNNREDCIDLFQDSVKRDIDTYAFGSYLRERDILYSYVCKDRYFVSIWQLKDLEKTALKDIPLNLNVNLDGVKFNAGEIFYKDLGYRPRITAKLGFTFNGVLNVNLDERTSILKRIDTSSYKGFFGTVNNMSFTDEKGEHLILFDFLSGKEPTLFLLYKGHGSFYAIFINSDKPFDESIIRILNLQ